MKFIFDCEDEILLPQAYGIVEDLNAITTQIKEDNLLVEGTSTKHIFKKFLETLCVKNPAETSRVFKRFWILEEGEKAPNALKTITAIFSNEDAVDFFTSVLPSLAQISSVFFQK
jgi:hypothetical protein